MELRDVIVSVRDLLSDPVGAGRPIFGSVTIELDRDVSADGWLRPAVARRVALPETGQVTVQLPVNDDPSITAGRGFGVLLTLTLEGGPGCDGRPFVRSFPARAVTRSTPNPVAFADLVEAIPLPVHVTVDDVIARAGVIASRLPEDAPALAPVVRALASGVCRVAVMGNGGALGVGATDQASTWASQLLDMLRQRFGTTDRGTGFLSAAQPLWGPTLAGCVPNRDGNNLDLGSVKMDTAGDSITWTNITGSLIGIVFTDTLHQQGVADILIDGAPGGVIDTRGTTDRHTPGAITYAPAVAPGLHTVQVVCRTGQVDVAGVIGSTGDGISMWRTGDPGQDTTGWAAGEWWAPVLATARPHLTVFGCGLEDYQSTPERFVTNLGRVRDRALAAAPSSVLMIVLDSAPGSGRFEDAAAARFQNDPAVVVLRESTVWSARADGSDPAGWMVDQTHRSNWGQAQYAAWIYRALTRTLPPDLVITVNPPPQSTSTTTTTTTTTRAPEWGPIDGGLL